MSGNERLGIEIVVDKVIVETDLAGSINRIISDASKNITPINLNNAMGDTSAFLKGFSDLFNGMSTNTAKLTKAIDEVVIKTREISKVTQEVDKEVEKKVNSIANSLTKTLGGAATTLKKDLAQAFEFNGTEQGLAKLVKTENTVVKIAGELFNLKKNAADAQAAFANINFDTSQVKIFRQDKLQAEFSAMQGKLKELYSSSSMFVSDNRKNTDVADISAFMSVKNGLNRNIGKLTTASLVDGNGNLDAATFDKVAQATKRLTDAYEVLVSATKRNKINDSLKLDEFKFEGSVKSIVDKFGLLYNSINLFNQKNPTNIIPNIVVPTADLIKSAKDLEQYKQTYDSWIKYLKANEQTVSFNNNPGTLDSKKNNLQNRINNTAADIQAWNDNSKNKATTLSTAGLDVSSIVDAKSFRAVSDALALLKSELQNFKKEANGEMRLAGQLDAARKEADALGASIVSDMSKFAQLEHTLKATQQSFNNSLLKVTNSDPTKQLGVESQIATLQGLLANGKSKGGSFDVQEMSKYREELNKLTLQISDFKQTSSNIPKVGEIAALFKGIPASSVDLKVAEGLVASLGKTIKQLDNNEIKQLNSQLSVFKLKVNDAKTGLEEMKKSSGAFSFLGESIGGMLTRLTEFYSLRTVLFAVSGQFREATSAAIEHSQAIHDIIAISGDAKSELGAVSESIYAIAKSSRYSTQEVAGLMQTLAQAGVAGKDLPGTSMAVGMFATAAAANPKIAADLTTTAMNNFDIKATEVSRITNAMTAALNLSKLEASGLATAFNYLAPQAAQLGISMEKTLAIVATSAQAGIKSSTIGTGMSQFLKELAAPKPRLMKMMEAYGIDPASVDPMKKDFADIVQVLQDKKVSVADLFAAMESRVGRAAITAINLGAEKFREMEFNLTGTRAALIAYDKTMEGAKARINTTKQSFNELATEIGNYLSPMLILGVGALKDIIAVFAGDHGSIIKWVATLAIATAAVVTLTTTFNVLKASLSTGAIATAFSELSSSMSVVLVGVKNLAVGTLTLKQAISAVGSSIASLALNPYLLTLGLIAAGIGMVVYGLGEERRAEEAKNKSILESIDHNERLGRSYQSIINKDSERSKAYAEYLKLEKAGKEQSKEAISLLQTKLTLDEEQKKYLKALTDKGGPLDAHHKRLLEQEGTLQDIIELERQRRRESTVTTVSQVNSHNQKMYEYQLQQRGIIADGYSPFKSLKDKEYGATGYDEEKVNKVISDVLARNDFTSVEMQKKLDNATANTRKYSNETAAKSDFGYRELSDRSGKKNVAVVTPTAGGIYWESKELTDKPIKDLPPRKTGGGGKPSAPTPVWSDTYDYLTTKKTDRDNLLKELAEEKTDAKKQEELTKEILDIQTELRSLLLKKELDEVNKKSIHLDPKDNKYYFNDKNDEELNKILNGDDKKRAERLKAKLNEKGTTNNKALQSLFVDEAVSKVDSEITKYEQATEDANTKRTKIREAAEKKFTDEVHKLSVDESKRLSSLQKAALNEMIGSAYTDHKTRADLVVSAKLEAEKEANDAYIEGIGKLNADRDALAKTGGATVAEAEYKKGLALLGSNYTNRVSEYYSAIDKQSVSGDLATIDRNAAKQKEQVERGKEKLYNAKAIREVEATALEVEAQASLKKDEYLNKQKEIYEQQIMIKAVEGDQAEIERAALLGVNSQLLEQLEIRKKITREQKKLREDEWDSFKSGAGEAWKTQSDTNAMSSKLGGDLVNTGMNGLSDTLNNTFNTAFNPDQAKINEIKTQIASLTAEKKILESDIYTIDRNTSKTPVEIQSLNEKKIKLAEINAELNKQNTAVRSQTSAWQSFADGLKGVMVQILKELQTYIIKLLAISVAKQLAGLAGSALSGTGWGDSMGSALTAFSNGKADGGLIPNNIGVPGKDSVPAMLMPGEIVIKKSSVDYYGADKLLAMNDQRIQKFASGGLVGGGSSSGSGNSTAGGTTRSGDQVLQIVNIADSSQIPPTPVDAQQVINIITMDAGKRGPVYKTIKSVMAS